MAERDSDLRFADEVHQIVGMGAIYVLLLVLIRVHSWFGLFLFSKVVEA